jgi:hypothetical protein
LLVNVLLGSFDCLFLAFERMLVSQERLVSFALSAGNVDFWEIVLGHLRNERSVGSLQSGETLLSPGSSSDWGLKRK